MALHLTKNDQEEKLKDLIRPEKRQHKHIGGVMDVGVEKPFRRPG